MIVSSFASQYFGKGDLYGARRFGWYGLGGAVLTQLIAFITIPFLAGILSFPPYDPSVSSLLAQYIATRLLSPVVRPLAWISFVSVFYVFFPNSLMKHFADDSQNSGLLAVLALFLYFRFVSGKREKMQLTEEPVV